MPEDLTLKIDLSAPVTLASSVEVAREFFMWWFGELTDILPQSWRAKLLAMTQAPRITVEGDQWRLESHEGTTLVLAATTPGHELREELLHQAPEALARSIDVVLPRSEGLFKRITLPAGTATRLKQVVRLQIDRLSPFRGDDVQFDCVVVSRGSELPDTVGARTSDILVEVAVIPKRRLASLEQSFRSAGLVPRSFVLGETPLRFAPQGLPWTKRTQHRTVITIVGLLFWIAAVLLSSATSDAEIGDLRVQIAALAPQVERAQAAREKLISYQLHPQAISIYRAPVLDLLVDLTNRIPDTAHVSRLDLREAQVTLQGTAPADVNVQTLLARTPLLTNVHVTRTNTGKADFTATGTIKNSPKQER